MLKRHRPQLGKRGKRKLEELALARYYTSEWFRLACAGQGSGAADKGLFGLRPGYDKKTGAFDLVPTDNDRSPEGGWGVSAEYFVFDALREEIVRDGSSLSDALLVPHLVFPWLPGQKPKQWGAKQRAETDCVVLSESCAIVVEVKRRNHHIRASADFKHVRERTEDGSFRSAPEPIEQVARGAASFEERQQLYSPDRIFKMIVYVEPLSFECKGSAFRDGWLISWLGAAGEAPFLSAVRELTLELEPIAGKRDLLELGERMMSQFGNTSERRRGRIVCGQGPAFRNRMRLTGALMSKIASRARSGASAFYGARVLTNLVCEVQVGKRGGEPRYKHVKISGLLLTRSHAVLIDAKCWPVHVNTHVPFATVYTGDASEGAVHVDDSIRHDWDLESIHYVNRSGSLTLLKYASKSLEELDRYRERNRLCTMNVFLNPTSFHSDCEEFRQKTFIGYAKGKSDNVLAALEHLSASAVPIMGQAELDELANEIAAIAD